MKTVLFTACYLDGTYQGPNSRLERNIRYINYYRKLKAELGFDKFFMVDNGSSKENIDAFFKTIGPSEDIMWLHYPKHYPRGSTYDYPYLWRALWALKKPIREGYEKILSIDSDCYVLSNSLANHLKTNNMGWYALWSNKYDFAETACFVLNKDAFKSYFEYTKGDWMNKNLECMEKAIPFDYTLKNFNACRYGEHNLPQTIEMDYYGQASLDIPLTFGLKDNVLFKKG